MGAPNRPHCKQPDACRAKGRGHCRQCFGAFASAHEAFGAARANPEVKKRAAETRRRTAAARRQARAKERRVPGMMRADLGPRDWALIITALSALEGPALGPLAADLLRRLDAHLMGQVNGSHP